MKDVDDRNISFWNELCGTHLAKTLGITDDSLPSLKRFDDWYFAYYPYLMTHIPFAGVAGKRVLEIGLGYGTVAHKLMQCGADYHGLDIAEGPVKMARHRATLLGKAVHVVQGSALAMPYPDSHFDHVVTIGCLHHTGDLARGLREVHRVLKTGGHASVMVYSALSYRQWKAAPWQTLARWRTPDFTWSNADAGARRAYDANQEGDAAPSTTFITPREARLFLRPLFERVTVSPRNIGEDFFITPGLLGRKAVNAIFRRPLGLDLYIEGTKAAAR